MQTFKFKSTFWKTRWACAGFALLASAGSLTAVIVLFATATGEIDPLLAKIRAAPASSAVADRAPVRRARG